MSPPTAQEGLLPPPQGLQVLRGRHRVHRLQGRQAAPAVHPGARQDPAPPHLRHLGASPAHADRRHQAGAPPGAAALRLGLGAPPCESSCSTTCATKGKRGQEVEVKPGFARNYLLPQGLAARGHRRQPQVVREPAQEDRRPRRQGARGRAARRPARSPASRVELTKRVGETGTLYGSVTATEIAEALAAKGVQRRPAQARRRRRHQDHRRPPGERLPAPRRHRRADGHRPAGGVAPAWPSLRASAGEADRGRPAPRIEDFLDEPTRDLEAWRWLWAGDHRFPVRSHRGLARPRPRRSSSGCCGRSCRCRRTTCGSGSASST